MLPPDPRILGVFTSLDSGDRKLRPVLPSPDSCDSTVCPPGVCVQCLRVPPSPGTWGGPRGPEALPALLARPGEGTGSGFPPLPQREGYREVLRGERACAGLDVRERRSRFLAAALSKVRVKCDTPAKWEQKKHPSTRPSSSPPPFSMETRTRRRSRVCYGKVSPWSETVSGVPAGSELPVSGEGRRQAGRSLATYTCIHIFFPRLILFYSSSTYLYPSSPSLSRLIG